MAAKRSIPRWVVDLRRWKENGCYTTRQSAEVCGLPKETMANYLKGKIGFPKEEGRKRLYKGTGLECFRGEGEIKSWKEELREWMENEGKSNRDVANLSDGRISLPDVKHYTAPDSTKYPTKTHWDTLYEITMLDCFKSEYHGASRKDREKKVSGKEEAGVERPVKKSRIGDEMGAVVKKLEQLVGGLERTRMEFAKALPEAFGSKVLVDLYNPSMEERIEEIDTLLYFFAERVHRYFEIYKGKGERERLANTLGTKALGYVSSLINALLHQDDKLLSWVEMVDFPMRKKWKKQPVKEKPVKGGGKHGKDS